MRFMIISLFLVGTVGSLSGCYSFQGARQDVGFTGSMVEGTWPSCDQ